MAERKFDSLIFDLDGTVLDTVPDLALLTNRILREVGAPEHTQAEILSYVGAGVRRLIYLALPVDASEEVVDRSVKLWSEHFYEYSDHTFAYDGIPEALDAVRQKGAKTAIVSNKLQEGVDHIIELRLPKKFDALYGESDVTPRKPDPTGIQQAMNSIGADPSTTIYIGDSPSDIQAGKNAGVATAAVLWGYHKKEDFAECEPDIYLHDPKQISELA